MGDPVNAPRAVATSLTASIALLCATLLSPTADHAALGAQGAPLLTLADTALFPEGISRDAARARWLVSSVRNRTVVAVADDGTITPFARGLPADVGAILGIRVDSARGVLWATSAGLPPMAGYQPRDTARAMVLRLALADGRLLQRIDLPGADTARTPGDVVVARDGTAYVSDATAKRIYVIASDGRVVRTITSPWFHSVQGLVLVPDGASLIAADYRHGLVRVPLAAGDTATRIMTPEGQRAQGIDGLALHRGALIATHNGSSPGRVLRITLSEDGRTIAGLEVLERLDGTGEPTLGEVYGDAFIYIPNSPWPAFDAAGNRRPDVPLWRPEIRRLPLPR